MTRHSATTLIADQIACLRGGRLVFAGVSFQLASGQALVLRGRNGIGKSSLLRVIAGLVPLLEGQLTVNHSGLEQGDGEPDDVMQDSEIELSQLCHYFGHMDALKSVLSVAENLSFWRSYLGTEVQQGMDTIDALDATGIAALADLPAGYLSAGQRRRLALARLLVAPRPIWLLDEPTSALDVEGQRRLFEIVETHMQGGGLVIAATHTDLPFEIETLDLTPHAGIELAANDEDQIGFAS
jgi:heme exporter protein A